MPNILLDITRLLNRLYDGLLPTGVDRVGLAYIEHYGARARGFERTWLLHGAVRTAFTNGFRMAKKIPMQ
ncbi:hypothetical protein AXG89_33915 [Burkholderia sp. PAMC 26561]|nr:hypothetical protein AXG89_33915 [Burkholderia sp. PAMC 26561]